ncbi:hypothetical protein M1D51_20945 [Arthrobacter sp. R3-55]
MKKAVLTLEGTPSDVVAVSEAAAQAIAVNDRVRRPLFRELHRLHERRGAMAKTPDITRGRKRILWQATWGFLLSAGLSAALTAAVMFGPADRKSTYITAEQAASVASPAAVIGIVLLAVALFLPVPARPAARYGTVCTLIVGLFVIGLVTFRAVTGVADDRGFDSGQVAPWLIKMSLTLALLALLAWRLNRKRVLELQQDLSPAGRKEAMRNLRTAAEHLAATSLERWGQGAGGSVSAAWNDQLKQLERQGTPPAVIAQARAIGPVAWLARFVYGGDFDGDLRKILSP